LYGVYFPSKDQNTPNLGKLKNKLGEEDFKEFRRALEIS
jgi:hypothetical protein